MQVPVEEIEAAVVRHYTSRAGDPHRHLHLQINARVWAAGRWRGIHTVGVRDSLGAINGMGHAAVMCDPEFRAALARHGYSLDPASGEVAELAPYVGAVQRQDRSDRRHVERYEAEWRADHPHQEPGPRLRQAWDTPRLGHARPDKVVPQDGAELARRWVEELHLLASANRASRSRRRPRTSPHRGSGPSRPRRDCADAARATRSAWNAADIRGEMERRSPPPASSPIRSGASWPRTSPPAPSTPAPRSWHAPMSPNTSDPHLTTGPRGRGRLTTTLTTRAADPASLGCVHRAGSTTHSSPSWPR